LEAAIVGSLLSNVMGQVNNQRVINQQPVVSLKSASGSSVVVTKKVVFICLAALAVVLIFVYCLGTANRN